MREREEGRVPDWGKASLPSTTFTDALFTAGEEQLYGTVIRHLWLQMGLKGKQRLQKSRRWDDRVSEWEREREGKRGCG